VQVSIRDIAAARTASASQDGFAESKNLPQGLNETYERALLNIPKEERPQTIRALKWLLAAPRNLEVSELAEACRINLDADPILEEGTELDTAMSVLDTLPPGLVLLEKGTRGDTVVFGHSSFPEYLHITTTVR
jgi:hypothetical protein